MARKSGSTISQEELYPVGDEPAREELDDARLLDLDADQESPFLRAQKRISVRRSTLPKKTATHLTWGVLALGAIFILAIAATAAYRYGEHSWRFRIESSDDLEINGLTNVTRSQVIEVMGEDIGRNIFFVPLSQRKAQLEQIPWVESASVMRFVPNRLRIEIRERTPVAFARLGSKISLIDASGALMDLPVTGKKKFSFPVILGMNLGEPQSTRAARMKIYNQLVSALDSSGAHYSQNLSEVDLSDPDDVKVMASDPGGEVLVHLGSSDFLDRFKIYVSHVQEWRQQFARLDSVDLRYEHQIVVNPDLQGAVKQPPVSLSIAKAAMAAGVKPAVLTGHESVAAKIQSAATTKTTKPAVKPARRKVTKARRRKPVLTKAAQRKPIQSATPRQKVFGPPAQTTPNAVPPATQQTTTTSPAANPAKPGSKPSPSIPKGQVE
jgi:cell division protein FtsQ